MIHSSMGDAVLTNKETFMLDAMRKAYWNIAPRRD
jgi:hypothetical protein